jgi:hypothetical protein
VRTRDACGRSRGKALCRTGADHQLYGGHRAHASARCAPSPKISERYLLWAGFEKVTGDWLRTP